MERCQGLTSISKRDFYPMFMAAWEASFKKDTILKAFEATGLSLFEPHTEHQLFQHENVRLKEALINERQRRKRGKALPLEAAEEYHGGAFFWSPRKKAEAARVREEQRQEKLRAVEARRAARAAARLMRQEEKAREAADRALRQAARRTQQRLQQAQKTAQRGKRRRLKVATKAGSKKEQLRSLRVVVRPQVLQQAHHHLNHDTADQSNSQQNIDSYIYESRPIELNSRESRNNSDRTWLNNLILRC
ncbi:hypothetical protein EJ07DRAFT_120225 [Lizonia empirigonia]|nr:hypothetical protein EJ07DRAFT_120225 [Lizonia empirigonia]